MAKLKANLSAYLARVKAGEEIVVVERGKPIARLVAASIETSSDEEAYLRDLERKGRISMGSGTVPEEYWRMALSPDPAASVRTALQDERNEGR